MNEAAGVDISPHRSELLHEMSDRTRTDAQAGDAPPRVPGLGVSSGPERRGVEVLEIAATLRFDGTGFCLRP